MQVEVIVPARDAARLLPECLVAIEAQTKPAARIHISVAPSTDQTMRVAIDAAARDPRIVVHENPAGDRGSGLNVALDALDAATAAVAMVDAQSRLAEDYLAQAARILDDTGAAVVGGSMRPAANSVVSRGIAAALSSRAGVGDSSFHFEGDARDVDSVYLGVYRRTILDSVGRYDPALLRTEDDDMNAQIRALGGRIRLDPSIRSTYIGRQTLGALFRQYQGYGYWKVALAATRPGAIRLRHLVPAALVAAFAGAVVVSLLRWRPAVLVLTAAYVGGLAAVGLTTRLPLPSRLAMIAALASMHWGYGLGSWAAILTSKWRR